LANTFFTPQLLLCSCLSYSFLFHYVIFVSLCSVEMAPKIDLISDISPSKENWNIRVRVVSLWFVRDMKKDQLPYSLEMVLMDNKVVWFHLFLVFIFLFFINNFLFFFCQNNNFFVKVVCNCIKDFSFL
jgi:hypothetical protein